MGAGNYVIVGGGYSAAVDHSTLLISEWGRRRVGATTILHVQAEPDPWTRHVCHRMGQWPPLLALPGYEERHEAEAPGDFLLSDRFAAATGRQYGALGAPMQLDRVTRLERRDKHDLLVHLKSGGTIPAELVDICTGPGAMRRIERWVGGPLDPRGSTRSGGLCTRHAG